METIVIDNKRFVIKKCGHSSKAGFCNKCLLYYTSNYPNTTHYCSMTNCYDFIVIREVNVIDRIKLWFKKKIKL